MLLILQQAACTHKHTHSHWRSLCETAVDGNNLLASEQGEKWGQGKRDRERESPRKPILNMVRDDDEYQKGLKQKAYATSDLKSTVVCKRRRGRRRSRGVFYKKSMHT